MQPAEQITKPVMTVHRAYLISVSSIFFPEPFTPNVACVVENPRFGIHIKHRVIKRLVFRSNSSFRVSRSAFVRLNFYCCGNSCLEKETEI